MPTRRYLTVYFNGGEGAGTVLYTALEELSNKHPSSHFDWDVSEPVDCSECGGSPAPFTTPEDEQLCSLCAEDPGVQKVGHFRKEDLR